MKIIKEQQRLYTQLSQFLNQCHGEYHFYEQYLKEVRSLYMNVVHKWDTLNQMNVENINKMILHVAELKMTNNIRQYVNNCCIMDITDLDLLEHLCRFLEDFETF